MFDPVVSRLAVHHANLVIGGMADQRRHVGLVEFRNDILAEAADLFVDQGVALIAARPAVLKIANRFVFIPASLAFYVHGPTYRQCLNAALTGPGGLAAGPRSTYLRAAHALPHPPDRRPVDPPLQAVSG